MFYDLNNVKNKIILKKYKGSDKILNDILYQFKKYMINYYLDGNFNNNEYKSKDNFIDTFCVKLMQNFDTYGVDSIVYNIYKINPILFTHLWLLDDSVSLFAKHYCVNDENGFIKMTIKTSLDVLCRFFLYDDLIKVINNYIR